MKVVRSVPLVVALLAVVVLAGAASARPQVFEQLDPRLLDLKLDIQSLNLVNALNLNVEQLRGLAELAREAGRLEARTVAAARQEQDRAIEVLTRFRQGLERSEVPGPAAAGEVRVAEAPFKQLRVRHVEALQDVVRRARALLNPGQQAMVKTYRPCIVPLPNLVDPSRIGSAESEHQVKAFDRLRSLPERRFLKQRERFLEGYVQRLRVKHPGKSDPVAARREASDFLDRIRSLQDVDWQLNRDQLVATFIEDTEASFRPSGGPRPDRTDGFVRDFLLNPNLAALYEARAVALARPSAPGAR